MSEPHISRAVELHEAGMLYKDRGAMTREHMTLLGL
jgi:hypothetical protein